MLSLPGAADPVTATDPGLLELTFETLIARGPDGNYYPGLARDWAVSADGRSVTLNLKTGVVFSDGTALTPQVVAASLNRLHAADPGVLGPVESIAAAGETAVVVTLSRPYPPLWGALASVRSAISANAASGLVGTGPFIIESLTADSLELVANSAYRWAPDYYRVRGPARLDRVSVIRFADAAALAAAVTGGQVDLARGTDMTPETGWTAISAPGESLLYLGFNTRIAPYNDARVRRAVALLAAAGRSAVAGNLPGWVATDAYLPGGVPGSAELAPTGDPASLLNEAGFTRDAAGRYRSGETALQLVLTVGPRAEDQAVATAIVDSLRSAGIDAAVGAAPNSEQAYLARFTWGEPDILYYLLHTGAEANRSGYSDARADRLLEAAAGAMDETDRLAVYRALQAKLAEDCPWLPVLSSQERWIVRDGVRNVRAGTGGRLFLTTAAIK
ncbi:MAG: ABC transporter substrate-binding protein [Chloroflexota bacterium]